MGYIQNVLVLALLFIGFWFSLAPTENWAPAFVLENIPTYYHDKPLMQEIILQNQFFWFFMLCIAGVIGVGINIANR